VFGDVEAAKQYVSDAHYAHITTGLPLTISPSRPETWAGVFQGANDIDTTNDEEGAA
jgi:hypothetical protein